MNNYGDDIIIDVKNSNISITETKSIQQNIFCLYLDQLSVLTKVHLSITMAEPLI